jgi:hypothetical protein
MNSNCAASKVMIKPETAVVDYGMGNCAPCRRRCSMAAGSGFDVVVTSRAET